jgi:hypothetical protein
MDALLDINDSQLQLWHGDNHVVSPGYALLEGSEYRFGQGARHQARLRPREINTRFWWQLGTEPLQPALGPARHCADLVHAHLQTLHREAGAPSQWLIAAPGSMQREQLALLLGIVQQCPFDAVGLVHRSVALASVHSSSDTCFHLELQLHQALLSELRNDGERVSLVAAHPLPGCGLLQLQERLIEIIAAAFIRQTRFDPRRKADSEQQLYDALPKALLQLRSAQHCNIEGQGYNARVGRDELTAAGEHLVGSAGEYLSAEAQRLADPLLGLLPGLEQLARLDILNDAALQEAVTAQREHLVQSGAAALHFTTDLPALKAAAAPAPTAQSEPATPEVTTPPRAPSHMLAGAQARALQSGLSLERGWQLINRQGHWFVAGGSEPAPAVNGSPAAAHCALAPGDRLRLPDGTQVMLIDVAH